MTIMTVGGKVAAKELLDQAQTIIKTGKTKKRETLVDKKKLDKIKIKETKAEIVANEAKIKVKQEYLKVEERALNDTDTTLVDGDVTVDNKDETPIITVKPEDLK